MFILRKILIMIKKKIKKEATLDIIKTMLCSIIDYRNTSLSSCNDGDFKLSANSTKQCDMVLRWYFRPTN